jgi:hypothetical protein
MATKMSAEEKAVRDALAAVQADTGIQKANEALGVTTPTSTTTKQSLGGISDIDTSTAAGKQSADILNKLQSFVNKTEPEIVAKYDALGYSYNPATGAVTPKATTGGNTSGGGTNLPAVTGPTLAQDTFINTLALIMGKDEAAKPYVAELYKLVSGFYKTGSSINDAINLALYQAKENKAIPEFTNRFSGIFKLQERRAAGEAIDVPTIAEYIKSQQSLGDVLRQSGLGDLANETFLNTVMSTGKSVAESTTIITDVFDLIDNAPKEWKAQVAKTMPSATRADLAKALLTGTEGAKELERTVKKAGIVAAGSMQGLNVSDTLATDLLSKGQSYGTAGAQFARVAQILPTAQKLMSIESGLAPEKAYTTEQAVSATFDQNAAELQKLADLAERERARMSGRSGTIGSKSFASQARGAGLI